MKTVDSVGVEFGVVDAATTELNRIADATDKLAIKTTRMQTAFTKRIDSAGAMIMVRTLNQLVGNVQGADIAFMLLGRQIQILMFKLGPYGMAIAAVAIAFQSIKGYLDGINKQHEAFVKGADEAANRWYKLAEASKKAGQEYKIYLGLGIEELKVKLDDYKKKLTDMEWASRDLFKGMNIGLQQFDQLWVDTSNLTEKQKIKVREYRMLLQDIADIEKKITDWKNQQSKSDSGIYGQENFIKRRQAEELASEKEMIANNRKYWEQDRLITLEALSQKMDTEEKWLYEAQQKYKAYYDAINNANISNAEKEKAQANYRLLIEKELWTKKNKFMIDQMAATYDYLGNLAEKWAYGEKLTIASVTGNYVIMWLDAIEQVIRAKMIEALSTPATWGLAASYGAALVGIGALRGSIRQGVDKSLETYPQTPIYTQEYGTQYGTGVIVNAAGEPLTGRGASGISSSNSQIVNYFTISPRYELLDISQLSELRLKEIANTIGRYIQEGVATGQVGLS